MAIDWPIRIKVVYVDYVNGLERYGVRQVNGRD